MSAWGALGPGTRVLILALGGVATAGVGYLAWRAMAPVGPVVVVDEVSSAAPATEAVSASAQDKAGVDPVAEVVAGPDPDLPKIDTWRVSPDGEALVAGRAIPGAKIEVVVDDVSVADGAALDSGEFVLQFTLPPNPAPSLMWLSMTPRDRAAVASAEMVALAPIAGPKLAEVAPKPAPEAASADLPAAKVADAASAEGQAAAPPAALLVTGEGAVLLQDAAPADPVFAAQVMIDAIAYAPTGEVQVGGRGARGALLRLYLDNAEVASLTVPAEGRWLVTLGDTAPGLYTLRVDQIDTTGKVSSRFETPFQRETLNALAEAAETAPVAAAEPAGEAVGDAVAGDALPVVADAAVTTTEPEPEQPAEAVTVEVAAADPEPAASPAPEAPKSVTITVQPGFTLWGIAQERLGDGVLYVQVFEANRDTIRDPDLIYPGQVVSLPAAPSP